MAIDPSIALSVKSPQFESPVNQMANLYQLQGTQQANQLNQMKMDEYTRGVTEQNQFKNDLMSARDEEGIKNAYYAKGDVKGYNDYLKSKKETANLGLTGDKTQGEILKLKTEHGQSMLRDLSRNPSDANVTAHFEDIQQSSLYTPQEKQAAQGRLREVLAMSLPERQSYLAGQGAPAEGTPKPSSLATLQTEMNALPPNDPRRAAYTDAITKATTTTDPAMQEYNLAKSQGFTGSILDYKREIAKAGRTPAQAAAPTMTTIIDPTNPSRSLQVDARVYRGGGEGSPGVIGTGIKEPAVGVNLSAKTIQQREAKFPAATSALKGHLTDTDNLVKDLTELIAMPGLDEITGLVAGRLPGISDAARKAKAKYDKIVAKGGFNELQKMRDNSVTGGALGNVSDTEGKRLEASFAGLDRHQSADDVRAAAQAAINQLNASKSNLQDAYDLTYEYKGATPTQAAPAKANPHSSKTDAQIKAELGL